MDIRVIESIIAENYITRDELKQIEPVIDRFFKRFGIDVDFQGKFTHFIERLNDPRNEAPIHIEDLVNFFEDLADEYGDKIAAQLNNHQSNINLSTTFANTIYGGMNLRMLSTSTRPSMLWPNRGYRMLIYEPKCY